MKKVWIVVVLGVFVVFIVVGIVVLKENSEELKEFKCYVVIGEMEFCLCMICICSS